MASQNLKAKTEKVKAIARDVYRSLGSGFSEDVYDKAMQVGLRLAGINYESQKVIELKYKDHHVGEGYPDLVVRLGREKLITVLSSTCLLRTDASVQCVIRKRKVVPFFA